MKIKHVKQECPNSCSVACIAMVAGVTFDDVREKISRPALGQTETDHLLVYYGILPTRHSNDMQPNALYIATVPSLNKPGRMHSIVIDTRNGYMEVYDPNFGRENVKVYTSDDAFNWGSLTKITYCRNEVIESGMAKNAKLYHEEKANGHR